jgi:DnaJ family protein C protein 11
VLPSRFAIGYTSTPQDASVQSFFEEDEEDQEDPSASKFTKSDPRQAWGFELGASKDGLVLSTTFSRNIFGGSGPFPLLSSWSSEEYYPQNEESNLKQKPNPVRLEIQTSLDLHGAFVYTVKGTRRVGNFTRIGFGVGLQGSGLTLTVSWSRLGQNINVPIVICPPSLVDADILKWALLVPSTAFVLVEFGILRPQARRRWRKEVEKRRDELKKLLAKRKQDSAQAIDLMTSQVKRRQAEEASKDGLVIIHAEYGVARSNSRKKKSSNAEESIDVTIPVAALVKEGQLSIPRKVKKVSV